MDAVGQICSPCNAVAQQLHNAVRAKFWETLPSLFGLPEWELEAHERMRGASHTVGIF